MLAFGISPLSRTITNDLSDYTPRAATNVEKTAPRMQAKLLSNSIRPPGGCCSHGNICLRCCWAAHSRHLGNSTCSLRCRKRGRMLSSEDCSGVSMAADDPESPTNPPPRQRATHAHRQSSGVPNKRQAVLQTDVSRASSAWNRGEGTRLFEVAVRRGFGQSGVLPPHSIPGLLRRAQPLRALRAARRSVRLTLEGEVLASPKASRTF